MAENDWSTQLKKIEREFDGLPPEPSPAFKKMQSEEERRAQERTQQRAAMIGAGARLILVFALFGALGIWPYAKNCGAGWFGYVGTEAVIVAGGLWVAFTTWRYRLPKMHALSLLIILVGLVLIAAEVLPRTGYARVDPKNPPQLWCPETTAALPAIDPETRAALPSTGPETMGALSSTDLLGQRVRYATQSMGNRWQESSSDLVRQLRPQRAVLERIAHPESRLPRDP
ncbi:MAG: hypothetical protein M3P12_06430 [Gemmatimonadota bacterium]|nr:hypothetical protein [Gemmatimonadota bacterium]